jgi:class 3 adenylate cyclase
MPIERKLAAIMFTDIAGYTAQMSKDEAVAISLLNKKESILKPLIAKHNGTYVKSTGDGNKNIEKTMIFIGAKVKDL